MNYVTDTTGDENFNYKEGKLNCLPEEEIEEVLDRIKDALLEGQGSYCSLQNALEVIEDIKHEYIWSGM